MTKIVWKYFIPLMLVAAGISIIASDPARPYSHSIPVFFGAYRLPVGIGFIALAMAAAITIRRSSK